MILSKTDFMIYLVCAKNAWIKIHKSDIYKTKPMSSFEMSIIDTGNQIDELAREIFPGGVLVEKRDDIDLTKQLMMDKKSVIYQPVFSTGEFLAVSDIFVWNPNDGVYDLYEVKSSTVSEENGGKKIKDYIIDMAFQKNVLNDLGIKIGTCNLIGLNKDYVRSGDINLKELFLIDNLTDEVNVILDDIKLKMIEAHNYLSKEEEPDGYCDCILKCKNSHCTTSWYSNNNLPSYSIHEITRIHKKKLKELIDDNVLSIHDIPADFKLSANQRRQVDIAQSGKEYINTKQITQFLDSMEYPLAFLDYETYPSALPRYDGYRPYQQIPFQFSIHILDSAEGAMVHHDFLYVDQNNPDEFFVDALKRFLPKNGSILVWNQKFEKGINQQIGNRFHDCREYMNGINERIIDLMTPFSGSTMIYGHPDFRGSASIKYVLPALIPDLSYKDMHIQEGGAASDTWNRIVSGEYSQEIRDMKMQALKDYCKLDTLAMVEIWKVLNSVSSNSSTI